MLPRKLSGDGQNPEGIIPNINKINMQMAESSLPKEIRIVMGH
jgi:hypothetical protein